jgi:uncharacterized protein (TIGR02145 family)
MKKLFTVQYSKTKDRFFLTEKDEPVQGIPFDVPIIDAENNTVIELGAIMVDTEVIQASKPSQLSFVNPFNNPFAGHNYGLLYNSYTFQQNNLAPSGWRVPTVSDFEELFSYVGIETNRAIVLIDNNSDFNEPSFNGNLNEYLFTLRATGYRTNSGTFQFIGVRTTLGTSELVDSQISRAFPFYGNSSIPSPTNYYAKSGVSLRLIKEDGELIDSIIDVEGNRYPVTKIGNQVWTAANWKSTKFNDGTDIPNLTDNSAWANTADPAYCAYNNDESLV